MTVPHPHTSDIQAVNLVTAGDYQFAVWLTGTVASAELRVGRIQRGAQRWGIDHDEYEFTSTPRTALGLPQTRDDDHLFPAIGVDGLGRLHVWANMHLDSMRYVRTADPHTADTWLSAAGWVDASSELSSVDVRNTYPMPIHYPDGTLQFWNRTGTVQTTSGKSDFHYWTRAPGGTTWGSRVTLFQGLSVPDAGGAGVPGSDASVDDVTNWSAYFTVPVVESARGPHPGRLHVSWVWRTRGPAPDERSNVLAAYGYSDDKATTWRAIDGTALTVPITPLNSAAARVPGSAFIQSISRSSNVVIANLDTTNHEIQVGDTVRVWVQDTTYNGDFTVALIGNPASSIGWFQVAANDPAGGTGTLTRYGEDINWGGLTVDETTGLPHMLVSEAGTGVRYIRRNPGNTAWLQTPVSNPFGGLVHIVRKNCFWLRGDLWMLTTTQPNSLRRQRLIRVTGTGNPAVTLSGVIGAGGWEPSADPEAYRRFGTVETLACDGDRPRVFTFGRNTRRAAA